MDRIIWVCKFGVSEVQFPRRTKNCILHLTPSLSSNGSSVFLPRACYHLPASHSPGTHNMEEIKTQLQDYPKFTTRAEVREIYGKKGKVDETRFHELNYLQLVIKETLRLHPPAPLLIPREARETVEINGYLVPMKTKVLVNAWAIGQDPDYWSEPEIFNPERFLNSSIDYKGKDFGYIPFGAGRRICPGMLYGMVIVQLSLANLLYHFDWKLPGEMKPEDLDMDEALGLTVRRKHHLCSIPTPCLWTDYRKGSIGQGV